MGLRISIPASLSAFGTWLLKHPVVDDPSVVRVSLSLEAAQAPQGASER